MDGKASKRPYCAVRRTIGGILRTHHVSHRERLLHTRGYDFPSDHDPDLIDRVRDPHHPVLGLKIRPKNSIVQERRGSSVG